MSTSMSSPAWQNAVTKNDGRQGLSDLRSAGIRTARIVIVRLKKMTEVFG